ncbi:MAG: flippase-like domain-containing protein [Gammaproteobacteria bacterium]|nr:flippase-like domain-containing protein [Gammaproteobacteria bacterium]
MTQRIRIDVARRGFFARHGMLLVMLIGLVAAGMLIVHYGLREIFDSIAGVGWGILAVAGVHLVQVALSALAWRAVASPLWQGSLALFVLARWIREAVSSLLPMTQIGGEVIAARLLTLRGLRAGPAAATVVLDLGMEIVSQAVFTMVGLALLILDGHHGPVIEWTVLGLAGMLAIVPVFVLAQRRGLLHATERIFDRLGERFPLLGNASLEGLHDTIHAIYRTPSALLRSINVHLLSWLAGAFELWLVLYFLRTPVSFPHALILESLSQAIRSVAFMVPGAVGVQEGGFVLLGALYGLSPPVSLALSLVKRVREFVLGMPALLVWHQIESRRRWRAAEQ